MSLAISIVSHGQGAQVEALLRLLAQCPPGSVHRVWVTYNLPEPPLACDEWPFEVRSLRNSVPQGFGANHNQAFRQEQDDPRPAEFFAVLNPDLSWVTDPFPALLAAVAQPGAGCAYPRQITPQGRPQDHQRALPTPAALLCRYLIPSRGTPGRIDWVNAACLVFPTPVFQSIGGFDQAFHMYGEDVDLCLRLQLQGYRLVGVEQATVLHEAQRNSHKQWRHLRWHLASLWRLWHSEPYRQYRLQRNAQERSFR